MHWRVKGAMQKVLGVVPGGNSIHYRLQRNFGGMRDFRRELDIKVEDWTIMAAHLADVGLPMQGCRLLEIGTGWYPTFPLACLLGGAARIDTFDLNRHLKPELLRSCVSAMGNHLDTIAQATNALPADVARRHAQVQAALGQTFDLRQVSADTIRYHAPADAASTGLADGCIDVAFSNSVLEHVPPGVLDPLFRESMRVLRPGGVMFHSVNCGDHYAYVDRRIHQLHYLRYSDRAWSLWDNGFLYQNRLRAHEFVDAARRNGFEIVLDTSHARPERLEQLGRMHVHPRFRHIPPEQLCITSVDFIARKPD